MTPRLGLAALALVGALALGACKSTTYDSSLITTVPVETTTTLPSGTVAELLPRMVTEVQGLSEKVASGNRPGEAATRCEQYWAAMKADVADNYPDYVDSFDFIVRRCRSAADRKRPADADRAYKNILELKTAILG
jgi:hypothetical protein